MEFSGLANNKLNRGGNMKSKAFKKRLVLNKETIVNLNQSEMAAVYGGDYTKEVKTCELTCTLDTKSCWTLLPTCESICICPDPPIAQG
jgi:natural product precursor